MLRKKNVFPFPGKNRSCFTVFFFVRFAEHVFASDFLIKASKMGILNKTELICISFLMTLPTFVGCSLIPRGKGKTPIVEPIPMNLTLAEYASPGTSSRNPLIVDGFGLVYNLGENGCVEVESTHRQIVRDELKREEVQNINQWIDSRDTAIVRVQAKIRPGIRKGEAVDVEISLPPGSECKSLQGGILHKTILTEMYDAGYDLKRGKTWASVEGPILLDPNIDKGHPNYEKRAVILGKAICRHDRDFSFVLDTEGRNERQLARIASELQSQINRRFKIEGEPTGVAKARSQPSVCVDVKMHPHYREAPNRYLAVIMSTRCFENEKQNDERLKTLKQELFAPETSQYAALQLEALPARSGADVLYEGLQSPNRDVQFHSAEALAYMRKPGVGAILAEVAREDPKKRQAAVAALASMGSDLEAAEHLIPLMAHGDPTLRYGAFWALWRRNPEHPAIRAWPMETYPYHYHVLPFEEPMVHATKSRRAEIVLFSQNIRLNAPFVGNAGKTIVVNVLSPNEVRVERVKPGGINETRLRPNSLDKVLEAIAELGGTYQDAFEFLAEAGTEQSNGYRALACQFMVDGIELEKERSYNAAIYADYDKQDETPVAEEPKEKKSALGRLNPATWR